MDDRTVDALVHRHIKLDDLVHLAAEATVALGILGSELAQLGATREAYAAAIEQYLTTAGRTDRWAVEVDCLEKAGVLVRFCQEVQRLDPRLRLDFAAAHDAGELLDRAGVVLGEHTHDFQVVKSTLRRAREHRLAGDPVTALHLVTKPQTFFAGTGAEVEKANFELEQVFCLIEAESPDGIVGRLDEYAGYWEDNEWARNWATRGRYDQAVALAHLVRREPGDVDVAVSSLRMAVDRLGGHPDVHVVGLMERVSNLLLLAGLGATRDGARALTETRRALAELESVRSRWTVVARSPSPLSLVLRVALGELARVLSAVRGPDPTEVARLAIHVALVAKHSGVAELLRAQRDVMGPRVRRLLKEVVVAEDNLARATDDEQRQEAEKAIDRLRTRVEEDVSQLLAGLLLPSTFGDQDVDRIVARSDVRVLLDVVHLPTLQAVTVDDGWQVRLEWRWFRTGVYGPTDAEFDELVTGPGYDALFDNGIRDPYREVDHGIVDVFESSEVDQHPAWSQAASELIPERLLGLVRGSSAGGPLVEVVVSPHGDLSRLPWAALVVDDRGRRFVQCATIVHTPLLSSFAWSGEPVIAPALIRIVDDSTLDPEPEQDAWGLRADGGTAVTLAVRSDLRTGAPTPLTGTLAARLAEPPHGGWGLVYVTCHGDGHGFDQRLSLPDGDLTAGASLGHRWPPSVVLNACHAAVVDDDEMSEPMGFVIAAMAGGAREVVGAVHVIGAPGAARIGAAVIDGLAAGTPLHELLNRAQRALIDQGDDVREWASLAAFVR